MGMDVYGKNATSEKGEYFRNNVWWWRPLWDYCLAVAPSVAGKVKHGHSNDGDGLGKVGALKLAKVLREQLELGHTAEYAKKYQAEIDAIPDEKCDLCSGTGKRPDADRFGKEWMNQCKGCNGCNGKGTRPPFAKWYPFSVENVTEFAEFLENSGGFKIC